MGKNAEKNKIKSDKYQEMLFTASCAALGGIMANCYSTQHNSSNAAEEAVNEARALLRELGYEVE